MAGTDLDITNIATVAFLDECVLYPGNTSKRDHHYITQVEYDAEGETGPSTESVAGSPLSQGTSEASESHPTSRRASPVLNERVSASTAG